MPEPLLFTDGLDFGESPRWHEGRLWYADFYQRTVCAVAMDGTREIVVEVPSQPSGLGWLPDGSLLVVSMLDRTVRRWDGQRLTVHADLSEVATHECNDMVVDGRGNAYVGNYGFDFHAEGPAGLRPARLALVRPDGTARAVADDLLFPNGSVITPDGQTLIVAESGGSRFTAFTITEDGTLKDRREWAAVPGYAPDGCTLDDHEGIWFADGLGASVARVTEGGRITDSIEVGMNTYACMLGGGDGRTLFICACPHVAPIDATGAGAGVIMTVRVPHPHAGLP